MVWPLFGLPGKELTFESLCEREVQDFGFSF